ncbi:hypothetical protein [Streptomyces mirabilis]|uniref:hypothetical protein n=1 Tax=Streptomyces mirabilis TaxID=68239 RepID=UPI0033B4A023
MTDRENLHGLLGEWVTVRNPDLPVSWYGRLVGIHDDPGVLLAIPGRGGTCLPQRYTITAAEAPAAVPAAQGLPDGALDSAAAGADMLDAWAQTPAGRNLLAHALTQLARDGWLRPEPGDGWDPVPDPAAPTPGTAPADTRPDMSKTETGNRGGHVRTRDVGEEPPTCLTPPTRTDVVRTHPDTDTADTPDLGVRIEYRARVRRDQVHLAFAEALNAIARETDRCECGQRGEFISADTSGAHWHAAPD